jgi:hypothetical protein
MLLLLPLVITSSSEYLNYFALPTGWDLSVGNRDIENMGPCNATRPAYVPPQQILADCDADLSCLSTNYVPKQPGVGTNCSWLKTAGQNDAVKAFVHRTRCNKSLNATLVQSPNERSYKHCPTVGDAFYDRIGAVNASTYAGCMAACDANADCAAAQTDGHSCTLLTTHTSTMCGDTPPGCDAWFKVDEVTTNVS